MKTFLNRKSKIENSLAFTLVELLIVISIIGALAAFTLSVLKSVKQGQYRQTATAELKQIELAIERYHDAYGTYPLGNTNNPAMSQLFYELAGVGLNGLNYQTLDGATTIAVSLFQSTFYTGGIINSTKGSGEDAAAAKTFLSGLKPNRIGDLGSGVKLLITSVRGPDDAYKPVGVQDVNPFRYNSANPTNNPNSYDLWVDLVISGKTNRISNWSKTYQIIK